MSLVSLLQYTYTSTLLIEDLVSGFKIHTTLYLIKTYCCSFIVSKIAIHLLSTKNTENLRKLFTRSDGKLYSAGDKVKRLDFVQLLQYVAKHKAEAFYTGHFAQEIVDAVSCKITYAEPWLEKATILKCLSYALNIVSSLSY